ncbi:3-deoxy-D-manno-octulosonic-acid transferase [Halanaerobium saccharolyticum]|uniref:3-deoxy-D-manno-octulosonic acid transferase n=1 Tax=Halanaerobium saccharolyticum TaxID=43595 RepID=A0A4R7ZF55_9FIRM|nr:3-deoxy-D-manno-octulosonic acid transferase [Halanaerobium saccharolyticum]RAK11934.1 3-deoxy-D-manno-octulosonic-acid transferase [Halanaerobium saccharolyticum]TDW07775.1 3-deoxy-D-manno-octulosonic-acid transferase [Halanaerobium saccharolyticum]TDX64696.1 3-deoxy-D-manno-octulosonic-acid transferase [Halanaerobium saccharolyticum]
MYFVYNSLLSILTVFLLPYYYFKSKKSGEKLNLRERFAFYDQNLDLLFPAPQVIWIQAASAGETLAAQKLTAEIREKHPEARIIFSTMTASGKNLAKKKIKGADLIIYLPFDLNWVVKKSVKIFQPDLFIMIETELWPNLIRALDKQGAQIMLASGRISDDSFGQYKYLGSLLEDMLERVDIFSMQHQEAAEKIKDLGAAEDHVCINGNLKYDIDLNLPTKEEYFQKRKLFQIKDQTKVLVAGSTHQGEEEMIIDLYQQLKPDFEKLKVLLAPRYVERREDLLDLCREKGTAAVLYSELKRNEIQLAEDTDVIIIDTMGELAQLYFYADLVFIGGSLIDRGGHNVIEAAARAKVVLFGQSMYNFKEERDFLLENEVAFEIENADDFFEKTYQLLANDQYRKQRAEKAAELIDQNRGSVRKQLQLVDVLLEQGEDYNGG